MYSPASSRLSATAWCLSRGWRMRVLRETPIFARGGPHRSCRCNRRYPLVQALRRVDVDRSGALVSVGHRPTRIRFSQRKANEAHRSQAAPTGREPTPLSQRHRRPRSFRQIRIAAKNAPRKSREGDCVELEFEVFGCLRPPLFEQNDGSACKSASSESSDYEPSRALPLTAYEGGGSE